MSTGIAAEWSERLGLADAPLFSAARDNMDEISHRVLLDGGSGSFALSALDEKSIDSTELASWAWSCDLPHHVGVTSDHVYVLRWDVPHLRKFVRSSVERQIENFYKYICHDDTEVSGSIVSHMIELFRRIRGATAESGFSDEASIHVFLYFLSAMMRRHGHSAVEDVDNFASDENLNLDFIEVYRGIVPKYYRPLAEHFMLYSGAGAKLRLWPSLTVRHAGGIVFQEAHHDLERWQSSDLLGLPSAVNVRITGRGGIHFTPPGLARVLVEQVLRQVQNNREISIFDPACGSGIFLHEALRTLRRVGYAGRVTLTGFDLSSNAVAMAKFTLKQAIDDWPEHREQVKVNIQQHDSLEDKTVWPAADIIVMNPPFVSWGALGEIARQQLRHLLGDTYAGRADLSMAFIQRALDSLKSGGALGTLLPASLYTLASGRKWREKLLEQGKIELLALLGDHTLFRYG